MAKKMKLEIPYKVLDYEIENPVDLFHEMKEELDFPAKVVRGNVMHRRQELFGNASFVYPSMPNKKQLFTEGGIALKILKIMLQKSHVTVEEANKNYSLLIQLYDPRGVILWHSDKTAKLNPSSDILSASFYAEDWEKESKEWEMMCFRDKKTKCTTDRRLFNGLMLAMPVSSMTDFEHCTRGRCKTERINVTLREMAEEM
jgi:alkylated DNA repair dioxygenase AlkB